ncbi:MAG: squalene--hopene cyclase, partial [Chloroflexi bacterium]|nr:squalene--hopene cyclase [Chloroflexota bacterium]
MVDMSNKIDTRIRLNALNQTIVRAQDYMLKVQYADGYWWGELESNATMEAEFIMMTHFLGVADAERRRKLANHILAKQREDGTWGQFYGAPGDLSTTAECYFALKLAGRSSDDPMMQKAREFILSKGGIPRTRVFTKIWLSLFGQWPWEGVPVLPAELIFVPSWLPFNIYEFSSWARATIVPLLILMDRKPVKPIPASAQIDELYPSPRHLTDCSVIRPTRLIGWDTLFYAGDTVLRQLERLPWKPTRGQALKRAEEWIVERQEADGSWGGIQPPWVYSLMALHTLGYPVDHPVIAKGLAGFEGFAIEEGDSMRVQACISPLWDTALAMIALADAELGESHPALVKAGEWLQKEQVLEGGDWQVKVKKALPGGWAFEFHNQTYPDVDDTAEIVMALDKARLPSEADKRRAIDRAVQWIFGMQCSNGGWAAFDKDNTRALIAKLPFNDFGEAIDPPSVDVTAHVLEMLGQLG